MNKSDKKIPAFMDLMFMEYLPCARHCVLSFHRHSLLFLTATFEVVPLWLLAMLTNSDLRFSPSHLAVDSLIQQLLRSNGFS